MVLVCFVQPCDWITLINLAMEPVNGSWGHFGLPCISSIAMIKLLNTEDAC